MAIPEHSGRRTYFLLADIEPKEVANFGMTSGVPFDADSTLEALGHLIAYWTVTDESDINVLQATAQDIFDVTLGAYVLIRRERGDDWGSLPQRVIQHSWVEARDVEARANVIGTIHARYRTLAVEVDGPRGDDLKTSASVAQKFARNSPVRIAFRDFLASTNQRGDDAFLYSYRAVENVRRATAPDKVGADGKTEPDWSSMHAALGTSETMLTDLTSAATCVRHGDDSGLGIVAARANRMAVLGLGDDVLRRFLRHEGFTW